MHCKCRAFPAGPMIIKRISVLLSAAFPIGNLDRIKDNSAVIWFSNLWFADLTLLVQEPWFFLINFYKSHQHFQPNSYMDWENIENRFWKMSTGNSFHFGTRINGPEMAPPIYMGVIHFIWIWILKQEADMECFGWIAMLWRQFYNPHLLWVDFNNLINAPDFFPTFL